MSTQYEEQVTTTSLFWEIIKFTVLATLIVLPIRMFIAQPFIVRGESMEPTFSTGQYLIVDELSYHFRKPERGEVVVLRKEGQGPEFLIKRVIGLPGETVEITGSTVTIKTAENELGFQLEEPYVTFPKTDDSIVKELGPQEYFVMGDNRAASLDSRIIGPITGDHIIGRALIRLLPVAHAGVLPGLYEQPL